MLCPHPEDIPYTPRTNTTRHPKQRRRLHDGDTTAHPRWRWLLSGTATDTHTHKHATATARPHSSANETPTSAFPHPQGTQSSAALRRLAPWPRPSGKLIVLLLVAGDANILTCFTASGHTHTHAYIAPRRPAGERRRVVLGVPQTFTGQLGLLAAGAEPLQPPCIDRVDEVVVVAASAATLTRHAPIRRASPSPEPIALGGRKFELMDCLPPAASSPGPGGRTSSRCPPPECPATQGLRRCGGRAGSPP